MSLAISQAVQTDNLKLESPPRSLTINLQHHRQCHAVFATVQSGRKAQKQRSAALLLLHTAEFGQRTSNNLRRSSITARILAIRLPCHSARLRQF